MNVDITVHTTGEEPKEFEVPNNTKISELIERSSIEDKGDLHIFVGNYDCDLSSDYERKSQEKSGVEVDRNLTIGELENSEHLNIHFSRCIQIKVTVHYKDKSVSIEVNPSTTVNSLTKWAQKHESFDIDSLKAHQYDLRFKLSEGRKPPTSDSHIGDLVEGTSCDVEADLTRTEVPNAKANNND